MGDAALRTMLPLRVTLVLAAVAPFVACSSSSSSTPPPEGGDGGDGSDASGDAGVPGLVITDRGAVQGMQEKSGAWGYLGIPYAAPPVGALRWAAPQPRDRWTETLATTAFGAKCVQVDPNYQYAAIGKEDCLFVNVWTPATATPGSALPVLVYLHGGGFTGGSASDQWFYGFYINEGAELAAKTGAVVVTLNYRVGALGFLAHPALGEHPGNYGLLDQLFALQWVQTNIAAFGGDRARVLLFGDSAGAGSVCDLVASPLGKGLMSAALMESGGCTGVSTPAGAVATAQTFAKAVGCDTAPAPVSCMRALDARIVTLAIEGSAGLSPTVDGFVVNDVPLNVIASGAHNHVPMVVGSNSDETAGDVFGKYRFGMSQAQYEAAVLASANGDEHLADQVLAMYPASDYGGDPRAAEIAESTDAVFTCSARRTARSFAKGQSEPVWRYYFTHGMDNDAAMHAQGAWHGIEDIFVFRQLVYNGRYVPSAAEQSLADAIGGYWSRLAAGGDPNGGGAVTWPRYDPTIDNYLQIDETIKAGAGLRTEKCDFWDKMLPP